MSGCWLLVVVVVVHPISLGEEGAWPFFPLFSFRQTTADCGVVKTLLRCCCSDVMVAMVFCLGHLSLVPLLSFPPSLSSSLPPFLRASAAETEEEDSFVFFFFLALFATGVWSCHRLSAFPFLSSSIDQVSSLSICIIESPLSFHSKLWRVLCCII